MFKVRTKFCHLSFATTQNSLCKTLHGHFHVTSYLKRAIVMATVAEMSYLRQAIVMATKRVFYNRSWFCDLVSKKYMWLFLGPPGFEACCHKH